MNETFMCPCGSDDLTFDRSVCVCGAMHYFCGDCGGQVDDCYDERKVDVTPLEKAAVIDRHFTTALKQIAAWLTNDDQAHELHDVARARHILGHYEYGDTNLFEWTDGKVRAAILEELADAVVYQAWLEERAAQ